MFYYTIKRILQVIPVLFSISVIVFLMLHLIPGDPAVASIGIEATTEQIERTRIELGLDQPLHIQFYRFVGNAVKGDLGKSMRTGRPVASEIAKRYQYTIILAIGGTIFATILGVFAGIISAINQNKFLDNFVMFLTLLAVSTPSFWLALVLMLIFALQLRILPAIGVSTPYHFILPIICLGAQSAGLIARMTRSSMLEVLRQDYIRTARSKGLSATIVVINHALKNAAIPIVTVVGLRFGGLLAGTVLVESVFAIPGIGRLVVDGILSRDYPMVQGAILVVASSFVVINVVVDLIYALIDPRIKTS